MQQRQRQVWRRAALPFHDTTFNPAYRAAACQTAPSPDADGGPLRDGPDRAAIDSAATSKTPAARRKTAARHTARAPMSGTGPAYPGGVARRAALSTAPPGADGGQQRRGRG